MSPRDKQEDLDKIYMNFIEEHTANSVEIQVGNFEIQFCFNLSDV